MTDRRQFLASLAALPLSAAAGHQPYTAALPADLSVPCPDPTPGSVTNQNGSVGGTPLTDLVDAYSQVNGLDWQHQLYSVLTNSPDACAHYRQSQPGSTDPRMGSLFPDAGGVSWRAGGGGGDGRPPDVAGEGGLLVVARPGDPSPP